MLHPSTQARILTVWEAETVRFLDLTQAFSLYPPPLPPPPPVKDLSLAQYLIRVEEWNRKVFMPALAGSDAG